MGSSVLCCARRHSNIQGPALTLVALLLLLLASAAMASRPPPMPSGPAANGAVPAVDAALSTIADEGDSGETDTPRQALSRFLSNARSGNFYQAADELSLTSQDIEEMAQHARKLQAVIDRRLPFDEERLAKISDQPGGNKDDGRLDYDEIGRIDTPLGSESVLLIRHRLPNGGVHWMFSPKTVSRIPAWYALLPDHWLLDHLPESLLVTGPGSLLYWQWLALPLLLFLSAVFGVVFSMGLRIVLWMVLGRRPLFAAILERQTAPLRVLGAALALRLLLLSLFITATAEQTVRGLCNVVLIIGLIFCVWRIADVLTGRLRQSAWLAARPGLLGMTPLLHRIGEVSLWAVAILWSVQVMGYSVTAVLASLGLGGLAVALAAKNTLEHLLGGMTLSLDQPMRVGDLVKVGEVQGHVEQIGIRSTRIRTQDRSMVTIPNGKLADLNIETLAARDRLRFAMVLNISLTLKPQGLRDLHEALIARIKEQPLVSKDSVRVNYSALNESAIPVEISCWFETTSSDRYAEARHALLLALLEVVDAHGALAPGIVRSRP